MIQTAGDEAGSPIRHTFAPISQSPNNNNNNNTSGLLSNSSSSNNMTTINQHLNSLGSINHQLNTLSQQLCGLNQQSQNLQNFQASGGGAAATISAINFNQLLPTATSNAAAQPVDSLLQSHLYQSNQELLNRLQNLNLGFGGVGANSKNNNINNNNSIISNNAAYGVKQPALTSHPTTYQHFQHHHHQQSSSPSSPNNAALLLSSPSSMSNLTPSPILNRSSPYSASPSLFDDSSLGGLTMDWTAVTDHQRRTPPDHKNQFIRPLSQVSTMTTMDADGKVKVVVPVAGYGVGSGGSEMTAAAPRKPEKKVTIPEYVTLKVTDESGNITNSRKLSATPSFIQRSTSEKVPNRSQTMSEVQRSTWARHTTK